MHSIHLIAGSRSIAQGMMSGVSARIRAGQGPVVLEAWDLARRGIIADGLHNNT